MQISVIGHIEDLWDVTKGILVVGYGYLEDDDTSSSRFVYLRWGHPALLRS
jgi:hypothetical protein